jgi:hypothetical protein
VAGLVKTAPNYNVELRFTRVKPEVLALLRRDGIIDRLGESQIYGNVYEAAADKISNS